MVRYTTESLSDGWFAGGPVTITGAAAGAFAAALGETDAELLDGRCLPPTMAIIPAWISEDHAVAAAIGSDAAAQTVHAEHHFELLAPLRPDVPVVARSRIQEVAVKRRGTLVTVATETLDERTLVNRQRYAVFALGVFAELRDGVVPRTGSGPPARHPLPLHTLGARIERVDESWAGRYALASGDDFALHTDAAYARSLGYPGPILHGMCTLGIAARAVRELVGARHADDLTRLGARFAAPVLMPARLQTEVWTHDGELGPSSGVFRMRDLDRGVDVLTHGEFAVRLSGSR